MGLGVGGRWQPGLVTNLAALSRADRERLDEREDTEFREYRNALGRLLALAAQPYPRRPTVNAFVLAAALAAVPAGLGWAKSSSDKGTCAGHVGDIASGAS